MPYAFFLKNNQHVSENDEMLVNEWIGVRASALLRNYYSDSFSIYIKIYINNQMKING